MNIAIDTDVTFTFSGGRTAQVDGLELDDFLRDIFDKKCTHEPKIGHDGQPVLDESGQPVKVKTLSFANMEAMLIPWFKEKAGIDLKRSEARAVWATAQDAWSKKNASWLKQESEPLISQPSTDLMSLD